MHVCMENCDSSARAILCVQESPFSIHVRSPRILQLGPPLHHLKVQRFDEPAILKKLATASRQLAELKGIAASMPNQGILINTLGLQEAKDSSEIENIVRRMTSCSDDLAPEEAANPSAKEVLRYRQALRVGFEQVRTTGLLTANHNPADPGRARAQQRGLQEAARYRAQGRWWQNGLPAAPGSRRGRGSHARLERCNQRAG